MKCRSLWHTPLATVRTSTSRPMGLAISTFSIVRGLLGPWNTAAFMESSFLGQEIADENAGSRCGQGGPRRVAAAEAPPIARHDRDIGLGLRLGVELDGTLRPYEPARLQRRPESVFHEADRGVVSAAQGLAHDELAADELERLVREEDADIDQSVVLRTGPAPRADRIRRHEGTLRQAARDVNVADPTRRLRCP